MASANTIRCVALVKRLSHPRQPSYAKENDKVIHINHDHSVSVELEGLNIGDIGSNCAIVEALIDVETRAQLNQVTKQLNEAMKQKWYVIIHASYLCVSDSGAIMFGCNATITGQTQSQLFALK